MKNREAEHVVYMPRSFRQAESFLVNNARAAINVVELPNANHRRAAVLDNPARHYGF